MRNIFLEKSHKMWSELFPDPFVKKGLVAFTS